MVDIGIGSGKNQALYVYFIINWISPIRFYYENQQNFVEKYSPNVKLNIFQYYNGRQNMELV